MARALLFLIVSLWLFSTQNAAAQEVPISEAAKLHFGVGVGLLEAEGGPKYAEAYESFRRAYRASPSPKILSNLGLCAMELERDGEAIDAYEIYLKEVSDIPPKERARIEADLERLQAGLATLVLSVRPIGALIVDERIPDSGPSIINRYQFEDSTFEIRIRAGQHKIRIEADDYKPQIFVAAIAAGDQHDRRVKLVEIEGKKNPTKVSPAPEPDEQPPPRPTPATAGGRGISGASIAMLVVTGALTAGAVVVGVLALSTKADYETYEAGGSRLDAETVRDTGEALNITTDVLIAAAAASAVVSVVLLATTRGGKESAAVTVSPTVGGGVVGLDVRF